MKLFLAGFTTACCLFLLVSAHTPSASGDSYEVTVTRKTGNLYRIDGTGYYLQTRFCWEYAYREDAIISDYSRYGYTKGELCFDLDSPDCYDIVEVYYGEEPSVQGMKVLTTSGDIEEVDLLLVEDYLE